MLSSNANMHSQKLASNLIRSISQPSRGGNSLYGSIRRPARSKGNKKRRRGRDKHRHRSRKDRKGGANGKRRCVPASNSCDETTDESEETDNHETFESTDVM